MDERERCGSDYTHYGSDENRKQQAQAIPSAEQAAYAIDSDLFANKQAAMTPSAMVAYAQPTAVLRQRAAELRMLAASLEAFANTLPSQMTDMQAIRGFNQLMTAFNARVMNW